MGRKPKKNNTGLYQEIVGIIIVALGVFAFVSIYTGSAGILGRDFRDLLFGLFGFIAYMVPIFIMSAGMLVIVAFNKKTNIRKISVVSAVFYSLIALIHMFFLPNFDRSTYGSFLKSSFQYGEVYGAGSGIFGALPVYPLIVLVGVAGSYIFFSTIILVGIVILTNLSLHRVSRNIGEKIVSKVREQKEKRLYVEELKKSESKENDMIRKDDILSTPTEEERSNQEIKILDFGKPLSSENVSSENTVEAKEDPQKPEIADEKSPIKDNTEIDAMSIDYQSKKDNAQCYRIPPLDLLASPAAKKGNRSNKEDFKENARILEDTLASFGVTAKVVQISRGPAITRYELQPAPGVKVSRIVSLSDDIALNLAASGVRIEAPIPGKAAIGVEVPNTDVSMVLLREVLESNEFIQHPSKLAFCLGKDIAGKNIVADLAKMPHLLIAGATGSGKSVCINTLITSILYKATPEEVRLIMIDPKVVELSTYNNIPHLLVPVVTDPKKAAGALNWAVQEMTSRYKLFADKGVRDMPRYNELAEQTGEMKLPQIVVIIDELADLMMVAPNDVEDGICRLAQMARAAGIHLVIATQRPSVDVITGVIKANIPSRIAFAVSSQTDSRTILDMGGAEKLLGRGDMLFYPSGAAKPIRVQGAYLSEKEVEDIVEYIKGQVEPDYNQDIIEEIASANEFPNGDQETYDELLPNAIEIVVDSGQASISMIQRRLRVGYARAARLIDEMEKRGIVSGFDGSKPRNVLITKEDFEQMFGDSNT